eukprot:1159388-Pelagomonas_calceolata.AAC.4
MGLLPASDHHATADACIASLDDPGTLREAVQELLAHVTAADSPHYLRMLAMGLSSTAAQMVQVLAPLVPSPSQCVATPSAEKGAAGSDSGGAAGVGGSKTAAGKAGRSSVDSGGMMSSAARSSSAASLTGTTASSDASETAGRMGQPAGQAGLAGAAVLCDHAHEPPPDATAAVQQLRSAAAQCHGMLGLLHLIQQAGLGDCLCPPTNPLTLGTPGVDAYEGTGPHAHMLVGTPGVDALGPQQQQQQQQQHFDRLQGWLQFAVRGLEVGAVAGAALQADALVDLASHVQVCLCVCAHMRALLTGKGSGGIVGGFRS